MPSLAGTRQRQIHPFVVKTGTTKEYEKEVFNQLKTRWRLGHMQNRSQKLQKRSLDKKERPGEHTAGKLKTFSKQGFKKKDGTNSIILLESLQLLQEGHFPDSIATKAAGWEEENNFL